MAARRAIAVGTLLVALGGCAGRGAGPRPAAGALAASAVSLPDDPLARGEALLRDGRLGEAEVALGEAASRRPSDPRPSVALAQVRFARRDVAGALALLDRALAGGDAPDALVLRGRYRGVARRFDEAVADLDRATVLAPRDGEAWCVLSALQVARGDAWGARWAFARAAGVLARRDAVDRVWTLLVAMPADPIQPQEALDRCARGRAAALDGRWEEALHEQLNGLRKASRFEWCIAGLAEATWRLGDAAGAEGILRRLDATFDPAHPELRADAKGTLAELLLERGMPAEAARLAREVLAVRAERPLLLDVLARACEAEGDRGCARDALARLLARPRLPPEVRANAEARRRALDAGAVAGP